MWQAGRLFQSSLLKNTCIKYAKPNPLIVLRSNDVTSLQMEDPVSWKEFTETRPLVTKMQEAIAMQMMIDRASRSECEESRNQFNSTNLDFQNQNTKLAQR